MNIADMKFKNLFKLRSTGWYAEFEKSQAEMVVGNKGTRKNVTRVGIESGLLDPG